MKSLSRLLILLGSILAMLIITIAFVGQFSLANYFKAQRITPAVLKIPVGSTKEQVAAFLKAEGLGYDYIGDAKGIDSTSAVADNGYSSANLSGYMVSIIRNTSSGFLVYGNRQYFFFFDKEGKLIKATAKEVFTGL